MTKKIVIDNFVGWNSFVVKGIKKLDTKEFSTQALWEIIKKQACKKYPGNKTPITQFRKCLVILASENYIKRVDVGVYKISRLIK